MFSPYLIRILAAIAILTAGLAGCRSEPSPGETGERPSIGPMPAKLPFVPSEPETFQATIVTTVGDSVRKSVVARSGAKRRFEFDVEKAGRLVVIENDGNFLLLPSEGKFAVSERGGRESDDWSSFLTSKWISERVDAAFEQIESGPGERRFRVRFGDELRSEAIITVDDATGLVRRHEMYSIVDGEARLAMTVQFADVRLEAADSLFVIPEDFVKVSESEIRKLKRSLDSR